MGMCKVQKGQAPVLFDHGWGFVVRISDSVFFSAGKIPM